MNGEGFTSDDVSRIVASARAFADPARSPSAGVVTSGSIFSHGLVPDREGIASQVIFGPLSEPEARARRSGHVALASACLHPRLVPLVAEVLEASREAVLAVARCEAWWHAGEIYGPPGATLGPSPGAALWEWEPPAVEALDPGLRELHRINTQLRRLGSLPAWAEGHFGDEARWYDEALAGSGSSGLCAALDAVSPERAAAFEARHGLRPSELMVRVLPVPPPALRPFVRGPGGMEHPGPINVAFAKVVYVSQTLARSRELDVGTLALLELGRFLQLAFERLVHAHDASPTLPEWIARERLALVPSIESPRATRELSEADVFPDPDRSKLRRVVGLSLASASPGGDALVSLPTATFPLRLRDGQLGKPMIPVRSRRDQIVSACGRFVMVRLGGLESTHLSDGWVVRALDGTAIFEPELDASGLPLSWMTSEAKVRIVADEFDASEMQSSLASTAAALVLAEDGSFLTLAGHVLLRGSDPVIGFAFSVDAGAFDPTGQTLLVASNTILMQLDVRGAPRVLGRFALGPLLDQMVSARYRGSIPALAAALSAYGTLADIAKRDVAELAALTALDEGGETSPVDAREAKRILEMARRLRPLTKLSKLR